ncbi:CHC2 zinc finger domain-containing protein [Anaerobacillus isosaccharinicus]|uniref:Zinc finger CHC2-type domain-containing protein n=1 Tax=Anaerobacillus isosaccharinicus TaxID=1532552 RepID=A0A1S2L1H7_9BACI|nr:CHC2 zinc finger domain-containing protein [Anaerobacillus isosaccharinicus]MBA5588932.1 hypothetical protein [Anaerobacillus isosaccharinicus]QOY37657.1 hypothetical protein AWH56_008785 [Anaerobacillus isosaccharinicus]
MALPSIVKVAEELNIAFDPKNKTNRKELRAVCPFCGQSHKYHLSLNPDLNVYKCWHCKASGGVLQLEAEITGKSFVEVKLKYFGNKRKNPLHLAEKLSPRQLDVIGWLEVKRNDQEKFKRSFNQIIRDWQQHVYEQRKLAFAKLLLVEVGKDYSMIVNLIQDQSEMAYISTLLDDVMQMYSSNVWSEEWAYEGEYLANSAIDVAKNANDHNELIYLVMLRHETLFLHEQGYAQAL